VLSERVLGTAVPDRVVESLAPGRLARLHLTRLRPEWTWTDEPSTTPISSDQHHLWSLDGPRDRALYLARVLTADHPVWFSRWKEVPAVPVEAPGLLRRLAIRVRRLLSLAASEASFCTRLFTARRATR
jgi:hypothetical protein